MKRLKIYLNKVDKIENKIYNVVSYIIHSDKEIGYCLSAHAGNIKKYEICYLK